MTGVTRSRAFGAGHQAGAVMLVAIVFLLVIVSVMALTLVTMSGSDLLDSADNADATETLFLAEAALERASWQLVNGTACASLAPQGPFTFGRGQYSISSSLLNSTLCSLTVTGTMNNINRTLEADISIGGSGGWAVGDKDSGVATLLGWDGSNWTTTGPWPGLPAQDLHSVHCTDSSNCWAVGQKSSGIVLLRWQGSSWSRHTSGNSLPNVDLNGVFCIDADDCWAVGDNSSSAVTLHWDGSDWSQVAAPALPNKDLSAVHCATSVDCWAVGDRDGSSEFFGHWNGSAWSLGSSTFFVPNKDLSDVFCTATDDCHAVGEKGSFSENITRRTSGSWSPNVTLFAIPRVDLNGISCSSSSDCWVVGKKSGANEVIGQWNGSSWSRTIWSGVSNQDLNAVDVVSTTQAYAVGDQGTIARWDGSNWNDQISPTSSSLKSVSIVSAQSSGGAGSLINWHETIF